jgi:cytidyltransferase-like protein
MKGIVWKNKSNGQLCVTVGKNTGIQDGDIVEMRKKKLKLIVYSPVVGDLFHYGHLQSLLFAHSLGDYHVCGVFTDKAVEEYRSKPIANLQERKAIFDNLTCVDRVMVQQTRDPTDNLTRLHEEFPDAELILVHGSNWQVVPGAEYVQGVGGRLVQHPYYERLSNFKIIQHIVEMKDQVKDITSFTDYINSQKDSTNKAIISSKADTLRALKPLLTKSKIEEMMVFSTTDWKNKKNDILEKISAVFGSGKIVVRSSAVSEDTSEQSLAGSFESVLDVDSEHVEEAIQRVLASYKKKRAESSFNQFLVQRQTENIVMSGVVFTRTLEKNAPYYVINYDVSGSTNSVTSGREKKTVTLARSVENVPGEFTPVLAAVQEIEQLIPAFPLDIEFGVTSTDVVIFQVRPLAVNVHQESDEQKIRLRIEQLQEKFRTLAQKPGHLAGERTIFADMPDWNPAEIIGDSPRRLDYSLYDLIITDSAWHEARTSQGYANVAPAKLVELFGNKPYVNVRNTFNSFVPASVSHQLRSKLVEFYLEKLRKHPELQDKVEFEIVFSCYDLVFAERAQELLAACFSDADIRELETALKNLTNKLVVDSSRSIASDMATVLSMGGRREQILKAGDDPLQLLSAARQLLEDCRNKGTVQFSRLARLAFVGKIILKSLVLRGVIEAGLYDALLQSVSTVATQLSDDFKMLAQGKLSKEAFLAQYSHLRPGTYDITSLRYGAHPDLIIPSSLVVEDFVGKDSHIPVNVLEKIDVLFKEHGLLFSADTFFSFVRGAIESRERSKFEFTKNLSDAIELIAAAGDALGFTRAEMALLEVQEIVGPYPSIEHASSVWKEIIQKRAEERALDEKIVLPPIIFSSEDFEVVQSYESKPNFITRKKVEAPIVDLALGHDSIEGSIVLIESGDPGYDWIFTRKIAGLVTKYGGVASHMAIRCAEFGIPAAIGCGDMYNTLKNASSLLLDCRAQQLVPLRRS